MMTKDDFLSELRSALSGNVSAAVINDNIGYYENFINTEIRKGATEEEVLAGLGNPRLIAKTVIDTADKSDRRNVTADDADNENDNDDARIFGSESNIMPWWMILIIIFGIMIVIYIAVNVAIVILPVFIAAAIAYFIVRLFKKR